MCTYSLFLFFPPLTLKYKCTHMHSRTHTRAHLHNTGTTFMPCDLARHYANGQTCHLPEISETVWESETECQKEREEREREGDREREKFCTFVSLWEPLVKCKYSTYTGTMRFSCNTYLQCSVVWGQSILRRDTRDLGDLMWNCSKEHAMFTVHCLNSWKASWKARSEPKQPKSVTFWDS